MQDNGLTFATFLLAGATALMAVFVWRQVREIRRGFLFEQVRQVPLIAPLLVAMRHNDESPDENTGYSFLELSNVGQGTACSCRFTCHRDGQPVNVVSVPPIEPRGSYVTDIVLWHDGNSFPLHKLGFDTMMLWTIAT